MSRYVEHTGPGIGNGSWYLERSKVVDQRRPNPVECRGLGPRLVVFTCSNTPYLVDLPPGWYFSLRRYTLTTDLSETPGKVTFLDPVKVFLHFFTYNQGKIP